MTSIATETMNGDNGWVEYKKRTKEELGHLRKKSIDSTKMHPTEDQANKPNVAFFFFGGQISPRGFPNTISRHPVSSFL